MNWQDIATWIFLVLAAGFVGYFGKYLAKKVLREKTKGKTDLTPSEKARKKMEKLRLKKLKKS